MIASSTDWWIIWRHQKTVKTIIESKKISESFISWFRNLERRVLSFLFTSCLFILFFLRFTLSTSLKSIDSSFLNFSEIDRVKSIKTHRRFHLRLRTIHLLIKNLNKIFKSLQIFEYFRERQTGKKNFKRNCQENVQIEKISYIKSFLSSGIIKIENFANVESHNHCQ